MAAATMTAGAWSVVRAQRALPDAQDSDRLAGEGKEPSPASR